MDLITELLRNTYLLRVNKIDNLMNDIWKRYQYLLDNANNIEELWEARVYLYVIGWFYPEKFGIQAIERRLKHLHHPISLIEFFNMIDKNEVSEEQRQDLLFIKLEQLYKVIKKYKQLIKNNSYLDEKRLNEKERRFIGKRGSRDTALGF